MFHILPVDPFEPGPRIPHHDRHGRGLHPEHAPGFTPAPAAPPHVPRHMPSRHREHRHGHHEDPQMHRESSREHHERQREARGTQPQPRLRTLPTSHTESPEAAHHERSGSRWRGYEHSPGPLHPVHHGVLPLSDDPVIEIERPGVLSGLQYSAVIAQGVALHAINTEEIDPAETEVLDFGFEAGVFNASIVLQPHVKSVVGAAISQAVVDAYNIHASTTANVEREKMHAIALPYMGHLSSLEGQQFDLIIVSQPIEQRPDVFSVLPALAAQFLRPGGALYVSALDMRKIRFSVGEEIEEYNNDTLKAQFDEAGLERYTMVRDKSYGSGDNEPGRLYIAVGYKPCSDDDGFSMVEYEPGDP